MSSLLPGRRARNGTAALAVLLLMSLANRAAGNGAGADAHPALVPLPTSVQWRAGEFTLDAAVTVQADAGLEGAADAVRLLLGPATGFPFAAAAADAAVRITRDDALGPEAYTLRVTVDGIDIGASTETGAFYAAQTLRQLLPADIYSRQPVERTWRVPHVEISDAPRFGWRGMHLDVGRHFMPVEFVKKFIDAIAAHKFNSFHWHLTEDQGWRIEIKRYPKLTEVGAMRARTVVGLSFGGGKDAEYDGVPHGGYYTQDEIREVVAYAARRHVNIVPEIEFPGHAQAAIAAYPELGNTGRRLKVKEEWGINENTLKPSDETIAFYHNVLAEVIELFPSRYIHIGGDEAPKTQWEQSEFAQQRMRELGLADEHALQSWMIRQMDAFLTAHGRRLVGWDEIMQGGLSDNATVMSWRGMRPGEKAAALGHDVVMAPTFWTYFDYYQGDFDTEPPALPFYVPLRQVYAFDPIPRNLPERFHAHILGGQAQLWTELMKTPEHVEYMAFPRAAALAEVLWSPAGTRDYTGFVQRLKGHLPRLDVLGVNYRPPGNDELGFTGRIKAAILKLGMRLYFWRQGA